jgi:hypothetical protein
LKGSLLQSNPNQSNSLSTDKIASPDQEIHHTQELYDLLHGPNMTFDFGDLGTNFDCGLKEDDTHPSLKPDCKFSQVILQSWPARRARFFFKRDPLNWVLDVTENKLSSYAKCITGAGDCKKSYLPIGEPLKPWFTGINEGESIAFHGQASENGNALDGQFAFAFRLDKDTDYEILENSDIARSMSRSGGSIENILDNLSTANYREDIELSCTADVKWTWNGFLEARTYDPTSTDYRETIIYGLSIKYGPYQPNENVVKLMRKDSCKEKRTWTDSITMVNSSNKSWKELAGLPMPAQPLKINPYEDGQEDGIYWKFSIAGADSTSLRYWFRHRMFKFYPVRDSKHDIFAYPAESKALVGWIPVDAANEKRYKAFIIYGSYQPEKNHWQGVFIRSDQDTGGVWIARKFESMKSDHVEFTLR